MENTRKTADTVDIFFLLMTAIALLYNRVDIASFEVLVAIYYHVRRM